MFNNRRTLVGPHRLYRLTHFHDFQGIVNNHLLLGIAVQIGKFLQHLRGTSKKESCLSFLICHSLGSQNDSPKNIIFLIRIMGITGSTYRLFQLFSQGNNLLIIGNQILFRFCGKTI